MLDTCATANFITNGLAKTLNCITRPCNVQIGAVNNLSTKSSKLAELTIHSINSNFSKQIQCYVIPSISNAEPSESFSRDLIKISKTISLADPNFHVARPVDILLGSGPTIALLQSNRIKLTANASDLFCKKLSWVG